MAFPSSPAANQIHPVGDIRRVFKNGVWSRATGVIRRQITDNTIRPIFGDYQVLQPTGNLSLAIADFSTDNVNFDEFYLEIVNGGLYNITYPANFVFADGTVPELTDSGKDLLGVTRDPSTGNWIVVVIAKNIKVAS